MQVAPLDSVPLGGTPPQAEWSLWLLALLALVAAAIIVWKLVDLSVQTARATLLLERIDGLVERRMITEALAEARAADTPAGRVMAAGLARRSAGAAQVARTLDNAGRIENAELERGLIALAAVASVAPLLGFLGSVVALMDVLATPAATGDALAAALVPAATGLLLAVPVTLMHHYLAARSARASRELTRSSLRAADAIGVLDAGAGPTP